MENNVQKAIWNKFQFQIKSSSGKARKVAIIPSYLPTLGFEVDPAKQSIVSHHYHDVTALRAAGYMVDTVLDDANVKFEDGYIEMSTGNPTKTIRDFLHYIKTNPTLLKEMSIVSDTQDSFDTDMEVCELNPFTRNKEELIDISKFFDKYQQQSDRIDASFGNNELEVSDVLLWTVNVPAGSTMKITLRF